MLALVVVRSWVDVDSAEAALRRFSGPLEFVCFLTWRTAFRLAWAEAVGDPELAVVAFISMEKAAALQAEVGGVGSLHAEVALSAVAAATVESIATSQALPCG